MRPTGRALVLRYVAFAAMATLINLGMQRLIFAGGAEPVRFLLALIAGTGAGLVVKYFLDKRWIFYDEGQGLRAHGRKFSLYVIAGLATTTIFWGTETLFWVASHEPVMRELGAIVGLTIGYLIKYRLDRRFVFDRAQVS